MFVPILLAVLWAVTVLYSPFSDNVVSSAVRQHLIGGNLEEKLVKMMQENSRHLQETLVRAMDNHLMVVSLRDEVKEDLVARKTADLIKEEESSLLWNPYFFMTLAIVLVGFCYGLNCFKRSVVRYFHSGPDVTIQQHIADLVRFSNENRSAISEFLAINRTFDANLERGFTVVSEQVQASLRQDAQRHEILFREEAAKHRSIARESEARITRKLESGTTELRNKLHSVRSEMQEKLDAIQAHSRAVSSDVWEIHRGLADVKGMVGEVKTSFDGMTTQLEGLQYEGRCTRLLLAEALSGFDNNHGDTYDAVVERLGSLEKVVRDVEAGQKARSEEVAALRRDAAKLLEDGAKLKEESREVKGEVARVASVVDRLDAALNTPFDFPAGTEFPAGIDLPTGSDCHLAALTSPDYGADADYSAGNDPSASNEPSASTDIPPTGIDYSAGNDFLAGNDFSASTNMGELAQPSKLPTEVEQAFAEYTDDTPVPPFPQTSLPQLSQPSDFDMAAAVPPTADSTNMGELAQPRELPTEDEQASTEFTRNTASSPLSQLSQPPSDLDMDAPIPPPADVDMGAEDEQPKDDASSDDDILWEDVVLSAAAPDADMSDVDTNNADAPAEDTNMGASDQDRTLLDQIHAYNQRAAFDMSALMALEGPDFEYYDPEL